MPKASIAGPVQCLDHPSLASIRMNPTPCWRMQRQAADCLGVSERTLHRWRSAGLLKPGEHFRRKFPSPNSPLLYHLERCEEAMNHACARPWQQLERAPQESRETNKRF